VAKSVSRSARLGRGLRPASGYSGENPDWVDGFRLPPREGPGVPPVFGISLTGAVLAVSAGETLLAPAITRRLIEHFCNGPAPGTPVAGAAGGLSERELGVVLLVAQGLSNAEIAAGLYLSEATDKSHVARILAKLGLRDRVQVAVYAYEHGIVRPGRGAPSPGRGPRP
jgi:DNA-binding CsgD family transcriptional regulator